MARATSNDGGGGRIISIMILPFDASRRRRDLRSASRRGGGQAVRYSVPVNQSHTITAEERKASNE